MVRLAIPSSSPQPYTLLPHGDSAVELKGIGVFEETAEAARQQHAREAAQAADAELNRLFGTLKSQLTPAQMTEVKNDQRRWAIHQYGEPPAADAPIRREANILLTPHIAGSMKQARLDMGRLAIDEVLRFLRGEALQHEVTREMLPTQA